MDSMFIGFVLWCYMRIGRSFGGGGGGGSCGDRCGRVEFVFGGGEAVAVTHYWSRKVNTNTG